MLFRHPSTRDGRPQPLLAVAAAFAALIALTAGCSNSGGNLTTVLSSSPRTTTAKAAASTVKPAAAPTTRAAGAATAAPTAAGPVAIDPTAVLAKVVESLRPGYQVDSAVASGDLILTNLTGRVVGTGSLFSVTSGTATVEYLQVPPQVWVREPGGDWKAADTESVPKETLAPLSTPTALTFVAADGDGQHLHATYDGPSLGMADNPTIDADLVVGLDGALTVKYGATAQGKPVAVLTRLAPADPSPIGPPG